MSHLEQLAHSLSWFTNKKKKHPIKSENFDEEESHHGCTCSHCTQQFNINIFIIAVLKISLRKYFGCKSK